METKKEEQIKKTINVNMNHMNMLVSFSNNVVKTEKEETKDPVKQTIKKLTVCDSDDDDDSTHDNKVLVQSLEMQENLKRMQEIKEYSLKNKISK